MASTMQEHRIASGSGVNECLDQDVRWMAVQELANSPSLVRSPRLSQLLLYLATQTLLKRDDAITEQEIALSVFSRGNDFHPSSDTIVRSHLLRLRQRLEQHELQTSSKTDHFRISIPRGQYGVVFREQETLAAQVPRSSIAAEAVVQTSARSVTVGEAAGNSRFRVRGYGWIALALLVVMAAIVGHVVFPRPPAAEPILTNPLWLGLFAANQTTNIVAADSSLVILHQYLRHDTSLADYVSGNYRQSARAELAKNPEILNVGNRRYTSMVDASIVQHAGELATLRHASIEAHFAREFNIEDLKHGNAILSGSRGANPWVELFEPQMNFIVTNDYENGTVYVKNRHPIAGESERYIQGSGEPGKPLYGVLAYLPNLELPRNVLLLEGSSLAGTQGVLDLLFNERSLLPVLSRMRRKDGSLAHFEVLVASTVVNGNASKFQIVSYRVLD